MNIIPAEYIKDSVDSYFAKYSTTSHIIYWLVLIVTVAVIMALPFVYVDVSLQEAYISAAIQFLK